MIPTLMPAYGRDYKNKKSIEADLAADKDFVGALRYDQPNNYINKKQLLEQGVNIVNVRYNKLRSIHANIDLRKL